MGKTYLLERVQLIPRPLGEVFAFFSDAMNLEALTPGFLRFKILTPPPIPMTPGALIDYRLRLCGIPFHWQTRIDTFTAGVSFSDSQVRGPYRRWRHWHEFHAASGGVEMRDTVEYELPLGWLGRCVHALFVRRMLNSIFDYRRQQVAKLLG